MGNSQGIEESHRSRHLSEPVDRPTAPDGFAEGRSRRRLSRRAAIGGAAAALTAGLGMWWGIGRLMPPDLHEVRGSAAELDLPLQGVSGLAEAARASQRLAWQAIQAAEGTTRVLSPSSLTLSLAELAEGARGRSLISIDEALGLGGEKRSRAFGALRQALRRYESLPGSIDANEPPEHPVVHQAVQVLAIDAQVERRYLDRLARYYGAAAAEASRDEAQQVLDAWARMHTAGLIPDSGIRIDAQTVAVVQDALLFAARWRTPFEQDTTIQFSTGAGSKRVEAVTGAQRGPRLQRGRWEAMRIPYDEALAADVILPAEGLTPVSLTPADLEEVTRLLGAAPAEDHEVTMPRLDLSAKEDLRALLPGIDLADLSGIVPGGEGGQWVQQVRLQVGLKGTVGAALTEGAMTVSAPHDPFLVHRPYVLRVLDVRTGWPLFLAAVSDPGEPPGR